MPIALSVNLNKIALIRNSRDGDYPDVAAYGEQCLKLGAQGLTVHPRPDQRHIRPEDCYTLSERIRAFNQQNTTKVEFNIEGNPTATPQGSYPGLIEIVKKARPHQCTLVPDSDGQKTSDHGFDLKQSGEQLEPIIAALKTMGVRVSLFMDPDIEQISLCKSLGADRIELYTGPFAQAFQPFAEVNPQQAKTALFQDHCKAADYAASIGLKVNAGHDLNLHNLPMYRHLPHLAEVSIGHALTVDALEMGFEAAIRAYLAALNL